MARGRHADVTVTAYGRLRLENQAIPMVSQFCLTDVILPSESRP